MGLHQGAEGGPSSVHCRSHSLAAPHGAVFCVRQRQGVQRASSVHCRYQGQCVARQKTRTPRSRPTTATTTRTTATTNHQQRGGQQQQSQPTNCSENDTDYNGHNQLQRQPPNYRPNKRTAATTTNEQRTSDNEQGRELPQETVATAVAVSTAVGHILDTD